MLHNIPDSVKDANSVNSFKVKLGQFKDTLKEERSNTYSQCWELSEELQVEIEYHPIDPQDYESFLINNTDCGIDNNIVD